MAENSEIDMFNKILDKLYEVSKISYEQELERNKQLLLKSDYLIKYISVALVFINIFLPLAFKYNVINLNILILMYIVVSLPLLLSLFLAVRAQLLRQAKFFPTGKFLIKKIKDNTINYNNDSKFTNKIILYYSETTEQLQSSNDSRSNLLQNAYSSYLISIILTFVMIIVIMLIIT